MKRQIQGWLILFFAINVAALSTKDMTEEILLGINILFLSLSVTYIIITLLIMPVSKNTKNDAGTSKKAVATSEKVYSIGKFVSPGELDEGYILTLATNYSKLMFGLMDNRYKRSANVRRQCHLITTF